MENIFVNFFTNLFAVISELEKYTNIKANVEKSGVKLLKSKVNSVVHDKGTVRRLSDLRNVGQAKPPSVFI